MEPVRSDLAGEDGGAIATEHEETDDLLDRAFEAAIIRLVNSILTQAVRARASAIHIEPFERELRVRYRINGLLHKTLSPPKHLTAAITSRIKVMANLNIAERRRPQDGHMRIRVGDQELDTRVSVVPTAYGERVVLRLSDQTSVRLGADGIENAHQQNCPTVPMVEPGDRQRKSRGAADDGIDEDIAVAPPMARDHATDLQWL
jgi:general secretion pathway protein E